MLSPVSTPAVTTLFSQPAIVIYGHRSELLARLITYLATVSFVIWVTVVATVIVRLGAHRRYKSVHRLQMEVKKKRAYR